MFPGGTAIQCRTVDAPTYSRCDNAALTAGLFNDGASHFLMNDFDRPRGVVN